MLTLRAFGRLATALGIVVGFVLAGGKAQAQIGSERYSAVVTDANGTVMTAMNPDAPRYPASLTKMMTLYLTFEALRDGRLSLGQRLIMTDSASEMPPSKLGLPPGTGITVEGAILAVITKSANDVAALLGETLGGGSEERFAQVMTMKARALGMSNTTFRNASGLPNPDQMTTARDMATLGRRLIHDFPERYGYFSTVRTKVMGINLRSHNRMLDSYEGADGIKTGFINASGFNIVTSAVRSKPNGERVRMIAAVFGGSSWVERDRHAAALLDSAFSRSGVQIDEAPVMASRAAPLLGRAEAATRHARSTTVAARVPAARSRGTAQASRQPARTGRTTTAARATTQRPAQRNVAQASTTHRQTASASQSSLRTATLARPTPRRQIEQGDGGRPVAVAARSTAQKPLAPPVKRVASRD
ncbi:D-alanyl-D-alanine carboxypeptidase [Acetobacteraceae bacterium H6797]|nr:D-alanyl-D-alanine carboxypeptidase [Acetobacteraceae bacterium H6797]